MANLYSISFPNMLNTCRTNLISEKDAVKSNLYLLLNSERMSLYGDPYFGVTLKRALFEQTASILVDLLVDEIYTAIVTFIPQLFLRRSDIEIKLVNKSIIAQINATYIPNNTNDLYSISLTNFDNF